MPVTFSLDGDLTRQDTTPRGALPQENVDAWRELHREGAYFAKHPRYQERLHRDGLDHLTRLLQLNSTDTLLEVGCGYGRLLWHLRPLVNRAIGVDLAPEPIEQARELMRGRGGADLHVVDGGALSMIPDASVDAAYAFTVFQHMTREGVDAYAREIARVLRPGGRFVAQFLEGAGEEQIRPVAGEQSIGYRASQAAAVAERAGMIVQAVERDWLVDAYPAGYASWVWLSARKRSEWKSR